MSSSPPTTLGKYQIIREIARSNDIVYEAYDPLMNRRVAIKELAVASAMTPQQKEDRFRRFQREVKAAGSLAHPNIVTIYEFGQDGERHYMAMEYLDGHTLRNELDTHGFLTPIKAVEIALAILGALEFAHTNGVVHRDIKPDNIQLLTDGRIKLTDFGIARLTFEPNLTMDGQVFGTPSYMSPEQVIGKDIDARSDLFGVGVVLYEMVAGQKPFAGDNVIAITHAITNKHPDQPKQASHALWRVIEKAIDKTPGMRFSTAKEMHLALEDIERDMNSGAVVASGMPMAPPVINPFGHLAQQNPHALPVYTQPYIPQAPPAQYAHNPYQPAAPVNYTPYNPAAQGLPQVPIYYPPPPRRPMVSQETRSFLAKFLTTFIVVGLFVVLLVYAIIVLTNVATKPRPKANPSDPRVASNVPVTRPQAPPRSERKTQAPTEKVPDPEVEIIHKAAEAIGEKIEPDSLYKSQEEARAAAEELARAGDYEKAGIAFTEAFEKSRDIRDGAQALACVDHLIVEGPTRFAPAREILRRLGNANYDQETIRAYADKVNPL